MNDKEFIGYCDAHCKTERALFSSEQINRIIKLAGNPDTYDDSIPLHQWLSVKEEMQNLCDLARSKLMLSEINLSN